MIVTASYLGSTQAATLTVIAKAKDTKETKDIKDKEKERIPSEKISIKIEKEKESDNFQPFATEESEVEEPEVEGSASERSFIQPEERPEPGQQATEESDEEE